MSTDLDRDRAGQEPINSPEELADWFAVGNKPRQDVTDACPSVRAA